MNDADITDPQSSEIRDRYNWETPLLTGRAIASLAADTKVMSRTGRVQIVAELAQHYGLFDEKRDRAVSLRSLRFLIPFAFGSLRKYAALVPDITIPWWILLLHNLRSPKI